MRLAVIAPTDGATTHFRVDMPASRFKDITIKKYLPSKEIMKVYQIKEYCYQIDEDVVLIHRANPYTYHMANFLKERGKKLIFDTDDLEFGLPRNHMLYMQMVPKPMKDLTTKILNLCEEAWVTTYSLQRQIKNITSIPVLVIKNAVDDHLTSWHKSPDRLSKPYRLTWVGSVTHMPDMENSDFLSGLKMLCKETQDFELHLCGMPKKQNKFLFVNGQPMITPLKEEEKYEVVLKKLFYFVKKLYLRPILPIDKYPSFYDYATFTVSPLAMNAFNDSKSELKIIESGMKKLPIVCSPSATYLEFNREYPGTINIARGSKSWYRKMKYLLDEPNFRVEQGNKLFEIIKRKYDLSYWSKIREDRIKEIERKG